MAARRKSKAPQGFDPRQLQTPAAKTRIVQRSATEGLMRLGLRQRWRGDVYHRLLTLSTPKFLLVAAIVFLAANLVFAGLYFIQPGSVVGARPGSFLDILFFSVETFATIGYGVLSPATVYANTIMTVESLVGIMLVAVTTGVMFARVSRPTARVLFSKVAVITTYNGRRTLMVRMGNERRSQIIQAEVGMTVLRSERTAEDHFMRRFYDLTLLRARTPVFAMSYTAMHVIDEVSPLFGMSAQDMVDGEMELLVTVSGLEETMAQIVHARVSYLPDEILFDHRFADIFGVTDDGRRVIDYSRFHLSEPHK